MKPTRTARIGYRWDRGLGDDFVATSTFGTALARLWAHADGSATGLIVGDSEPETYRTLRQAQRAVDAALAGMPHDEWANCDDAEIVLATALDRVSDLVGDLAAMQMAKACAAALGDAPDGALATLMSELDTRTRQAEAEVDQ